MGWSILRRWISPSLRRWNSCKLGARMMSTNTTSIVNSDESSTSRLSSPWLMLPPTFEGGDMVYNFYSLAENKVKNFNKRSSGKEDESTQEEELPDDDALVKGSSHGWLVLFNERNCDLFLSNPISRRHIKLPPIHDLPIPEQNLRGGYGCVSKLIISCSPDEEECRAMMIFGVANDLAFCCPGRSTEWTPMGEGLYFHDGVGCKIARSYQDFVYSSRQKHLFCITKWEVLEGWNLHDHRYPMNVWLDEELKFKFDDNTYPWVARSEEERKLLKTCRRMQYFVFDEQSNQLFLVRRYTKKPRDDNEYPYRTIGFDVHKIDLASGKPSYMEGSLDGLAMFVGLGHSFAMSAAEFPGLKPNSIYFTDNHNHTPPKWVDTIYGGHDIGIFDYENRTFLPVIFPVMTKA